MNFKKIGIILFIIICVAGITLSSDTADIYDGNTNDVKVNVNISGDNNFKVESWVKELKNYDYRYDHCTGKNNKPRWTWLAMNDEKVKLIVAEYYYSPFPKAKITSDKWGNNASNIANITANPNDKDTPTLILTLKDGTEIKGEIQK
jgi:hypothetical protein